MFADPALRTPDGGLSYPKNVPIFITERRFGGVGAPEGLVNVPDIYTKNFRKVSVSAFLLLHYNTKIFRKIPKFSLKYQNFPQKI